MTARPPKVTLGIEMPFGEALERYIGVNPKEVEANIAKDKRKKPPGVKKPKKAGGKNVVSLKDRKTARHRGHG